MEVVAFGDPEIIEKNVRYSISLGLKELQMPPCVNGGVFVICGSGPSLADHVEEIISLQREGYPICAVKGAYDYLRGQGVTPNLYLTVDPRDRPINDPADETTYMIASRCDPNVFDKLIAKGLKHQICLWHSGTEMEKSYYLNKLAIGGGSTSGLRAINVAYVLGFKKFRLFGMDSCLINGEKRIGQGEVSKETFTYGLKVGEREFVCNGGMGRQAEEFQMIWDIMPDIHLDIAGDGLLAAIVEERRNLGLPV